ADSVFPCDRASKLNAHPQYAACQPFRGLKLARLAAIVENERVQVSVSGVEDVGAAKPRFSGPFSDQAQCLAEAPPRHDTILDDEIWRESPDGAEGALPALPYGEPFGGVAGNAHLDGVTGG